MKFTLNLQSFLLYQQIMSLSTLLIPAVCRTPVIYELCNGPCSPLSLCGSVVEHESTKHEGLRFDSSWGLRIFFLCPELVTRLFLLIQDKKIIAGLLTLLFLQMGKTAFQLHTARGMSCIFHYYQYYWDQNSNTLLFQRAQKQEQCIG